MTDERETSTPAPETSPVGTPAFFATSPLPSLWNSVWTAFRQARLVRLEARVRKLRCQMPDVATRSTQQLVIVAAAHTGTAPAAEWTPVTTSGRWRWAGAVVAVTLTVLGGVTVSVLQSQSRGGLAEARSERPRESEITPPMRTTVERTTLAPVEERLTALDQKVAQQADQLTNQTATLVSMTQQTDTQSTQLTTLATALTTVTDQVQRLEQQLTLQATRVAAHEKQLAAQARQLGTMRERTVTTPMAEAPQRRPGPPTLELLAPPAGLPPATSPADSSVPPSGTSFPRRTITLPASLGSVGLRRNAETTGGPRP